MMSMMIRITRYIPSKRFLYVCHPGLARSALVSLIEAEYIPFNKLVWHWRRGYCRERLIWAFQHLPFLLPQTRAFLTKYRQNGTENGCGHHRRAGEAEQARIEYLRVYISIHFFPRLSIPSCSFFLSLNL